MPDQRYTLQQVEEAWSSCTGCELGVRRQEVGGRFIFGEGAPRGIMFIGQDGATEQEEIDGRPFTSPAGLVLRKVIDKLGLNGSCYVTNISACRSCAPAFNPSDGKPIVRFNKRTKERTQVINDTVPSASQVAACLPRLYEEIYLVDPVLIVCLGGDAAKAIISERTFSIFSERGNPREITIPGAMHEPSLTPKKREWLRKLRGEMVMPTVQKRVRYLMLPTFEPGFALCRQADKSYQNPLDSFLADMKQAAQIYDRYLLDTYGTAPQARDITEGDLSEDINGS